MAKKEKAVIFGMAIYISLSLCMYRLRLCGRNGGLYIAREWSGKGDGVISLLYTE